MVGKATSGSYFSKFTILMLKSDSRAECPARTISFEIKGLSVAYIVLLIEAFTVTVSVLPL